jgi:hypothetical protein
MVAYLVSVSVKVLLVEVPVVEELLVVVVASKPFLMIILLTANPVLLEFTTKPSIRSCVTQK